MELLDGKKAAAKVQEDIAKEVAYLKQQSYRLRARRFCLFCGKPP